LWLERDVSFIERGIKKTLTPAYRQAGVSSLLQGEDGVRGRRKPWTTN